MKRFTVICNTHDARVKYGYGYGNSELIVDDDDINQLKNGKCLAYDDGENTIFISYKKEVEGACRIF